VWKLAQITHSTRTKPLPYRSRGGTFDLRAFQPSTGISTATIAFGDVVQFDVNVATANHRIVKSSTMANAPNVLSTAFLGVAVEDDSVTIGQTVRSHQVVVCIANKDTEFKFPTKLAGTAHESSLVGKRSAIAYDSTNGMFYADTANSTAGDASLVITEVIDAGTTNGFVAAKFLSTAVARLVSAAY
jgi:hypothetical protein